ncbi:hypothetical protein IDJ75_02280 [Mucilaginibacter rigui]|uniref:DUF4595 domain-containing protein n=1 Tax=Mucilaginibacter rigui TaxID=534635 RepID=A0ABR7X3F2_9SPHI|nr:hypothetical protein [Mucilaginibacter rigui]MBD1384090.1 hypothetical protein [Mucilaginibacter rigui]
MNKFSTLLLIVLSALCFQSCKKDAPSKTNDNPDPNAIYLVNQITLSKYGYTEVYALSYDNKNRLIECKYKEDLRRLVWDRYEYTYDNANRMIKREYYDGNDKLINTVNYQYTSAEAPKIGFVAVNDKGQITGIGTDYLVKYDAQGHILFYGSSSLYQPGEDHGLVYDDKNNPFKNIVGVNSHFNNEIRAFPAITTNNLLNTFDYGLWSFIYNKANYPTKASYTNRDGIEYIITYEYTIK